MASCAVRAARRSAGKRQEHRHAGDLRVIGLALELAGIPRGNELLRAHGESLWDESVPVEEPLEFKQPLGKEVSMRLTDAQWKALYAEAQELGFGPTTLARMWMLKELRASGALGPRQDASKQVLSSVRSRAETSTRS